ncbi:hypothetical protein [Paenibacillus chitinolyticus]|uniref:hypothetical protein n=1 Tax=Paenibacillus chitinolyticus TaxID=79263 RepID=UPI003635B6A1
MQKLIGDHSFGQIKQERNNNEHDLTVAESLEGDNLHEKYRYEYTDTGVPFLSDKTYKEFVDESNFLVRKNKKRTIKELEKGLNKSWDILILCIQLYENDINENKLPVNIKFFELFTYDYEDEIKKQLQTLQANNVKLYVEVAELFKKTISIRERVKVIADTINMSPILIFERPPTIQILEYNIDITLRLVEYVRSTSSRSAF